MKTIVIALGGNALLNPSGKQSLHEENSSISKVCKKIAILCKKTDYKIILTHGNGSQVGDELLRNEHSKNIVPELPFFILNAETQAQIGSIIETSLRSNLEKIHCKKEVSVVLTHVLVDKKDKAFKDPSKPIGPFYDKTQLNKELKLNKFKYIKTGSKYREVIASPSPKKILELNLIAKQTSNDIIIACGGGGIPMIKSNNNYKGTDAVIDKDLTSELLASSINAEKLVILTNSDFVYDSFKKNKKGIKEIRAKELKKRLESFEIGTIRPKVEAVIKFIENGGKEAYIGNVFMLEDIFARRSGTRIY